MNTKLDMYDKEAVQQFIYGILVENRLLREEAERQGALKDIYYKNLNKETARIDESTNRAEQAEGLLKRVIEILDVAQQGGYTPDTLEAAVNEALNAARETLGGKRDEQSV